MAQYVGHFNFYREEKMLRMLILVLAVLALAGCQALLPAVSYTCRHGEFGPSASLEAAKINEELIFNLSSLCAKEVDDG